MSKLDRRMRFLKVFQFTQGAVYVGFALWFTMISPLNYANVDQSTGFLVLFFFFFMFIAGLYFLIEAFSRKSEKMPRRRSLVASICTLPLWAFPAFVALELSIPLLMASPEEQMGLQSLALYFLQVGIIFLCTGIINISSSILIFRQRRKKTPPFSRKTGKTKHPAKAQSTD